MLFVRRGILFCRCKGIADIRKWFILLRLMPVSSLIPVFFCAFTINIMETETKHGNNISGL